MTKPTFSPVAILAAIEGWDAPVTDNFSALEDLITDPWPLDEYVIAATPPAASSYDRCIIAREDATAGWLLAVSDGSNWKLIPKQAAAQADSTAASVTDLKNDFNALLAKLRATGVIAP